MNASFLLQSITTMPFFASRAFLSMFLIALLVRFGEVVQAPPAWFVHNYTLILLGVMTAVEIWASQDVDVRQWLDQLDKVLKPSVNFAVNSNILGPEASGILAPLGMYQEQNSLLAYSWAALIAGGVWFITSLRSQVMETLTELDEDDDLGLQKALSWSENGWVIFGMIMVFFFPLIALGIFAFSVLGLFLLQKYLQRLEERQKIACRTCNEMIYSIAPSCFNCGTHNEEMRQVGFFGQAKNALVIDLSEQELQLTAKKRCRLCATRLKEKTISQQCPTCYTYTFENAQDVDHYLSALRQNLPKTMLISFALSFIPFLGLIPGAIYYRLNLITSLRRYVPRSIGCLTRWGVRLLNIILISLQPIPILGAFVLPLMCLTNYWVYQQVVRRESGRAFGGQMGMESDWEEEW